MTSCTHHDVIDVAVTPGEDGCEDCLRTRGSWVHLRVCQSCGHVGCWDSSPSRHATAHWLSERHPVVRSFEPGEDWFWGDADDVVLELDGVPAGSSHP